MKERISDILKQYGLSSSKLADMLGVQRSGISHILSGRNNPGYDFLVKLLHEFPEINANWLLLGNGPMLKSNAGPEGAETYNEPLENTIFTNIGSSSDLGSDNIKDNDVHSTDMEGYRSKQRFSDSNLIDRIVIFYKDGTFDAYSGKS